ncbi:PIN domain-containing protein [Streptomyces cinereoruber]|uniref:PIN domain-containing protein n=1 Tax=Streptomyces cinereoruber TaxID=67260 RepID=UPI003633F65A
MIILDTCVIRGMRLDGSDVEVLKAIVRTRTERVGTPWVALEELAAQKALDYLEAHREAARSYRRLQHRSYRVEPELAPADDEAVREKWRKKYASFLEVLPTSGRAALDGLYREANCLPPAATKGDGDKKVKVGARDVAIWLTAVEYAREHPDQTIYFVSSNHKDFTKGDAGYPSPMAEDIADLGDRFVHLTNLGELLEMIAPKIEFSSVDARGLLEYHAGYVADCARKSWKSMDDLATFQIRTPEGEIKAARGWLFPNDVEARLVDMRDVEAYRLGTEGWIVATTRWRFVGLAMGVTSVEQGANEWELRILFPFRTGNGHTPRILKASLAEPVADVSAVEWPPPMASWEYTQRLKQMAEAEGRNPTWVELLMGMLLALPALQKGSRVDAALPYQRQVMHHSELLSGSAGTDQSEGEQFDGE